MNLLSVAPFKGDPEFKEKYLIISELCNKNNLNLLLINEELNSGLNAASSISIYRTCDIAIVDLTMERPSCYYELGFLEALEKRIFLIAQVGTVIHQTLNKNKLQIYENLLSYEDVVSGIISELLS